MIGGERLFYLKFWVNWPPFCVFEPPIGEGGLGATYGDRLRFIGKSVVNFLLVSIELFSLGFTAQALRANIGSKSAISLQRGPAAPKFQVEGVAPHQPFFLRGHRSKTGPKNPYSCNVKLRSAITVVL